MIQIKSRKILYMIRELKRGFDDVFFIFFESKEATEKEKELSKKNKSWESARLTLDKPYYIFEDKQAIKIIEKYLKDKKTK